MSVESQGDVLESGAMFCPNGCVIERDGVRFRYSGEVYVLPKAAYRSILMTE